MKQRLRRAWPLGIRAQLMLWYTAIFALLLALFGGVYFAQLQRSLYTNVDTTMQLRAEQIALGISNENGIITIQDVTGELPGLTATPSGTNVDGPNGASSTAQSTGKTDLRFGTLVRILDAQGRVVYITPTMRSLTLPSAGVRAALAGSSSHETITARGGSVRLYSSPLNEAGHVFGVIQVGESLSSVESTLRTSAVVLFLLAPFALVMGGLGSYWLASRAFGPVHRLTQAAQRITAKDLHQRVPVPPARDEVHDLAQTLNAMIARLELAFTQQRRFVADASHELRTPVAAIRSLTEVTLEQDDLSTEESRATLEAVRAESERLGQLVTDLLALARSDEGQTPLDRVPVRLDDLATDTLAVAEPLAQERDIRLTLVAPRPVVVEGDEARLIQVLMNLLDNAIRYTPPGGSVEVSIAAEGAQALLRVRDSGRGIAPEHLAHIFERFYRADPARSRADGGSGLGLAIVDWAVRAHGGTISVESVVGRGSTFTVALPLAAEHAVEAPPPTPAPQRSTAESAHLPR